MWRSGGGTRAALVGIAVAGDQREALVAGVQPNAAQHPPDAVLRDPQAAPLLPGQLGANPPGPEARVPERERDDPLLQVRADLVGHPRPPALADVSASRPQRSTRCFQAVIGRRPRPSRDTPPRRAQLLGQREQPQAKSEEHVILCHRLALLWFRSPENEPTRRRPRPAGRGRLTQQPLSIPQPKGCCENSGLVRPRPGSPARPAPGQRAVRRQRAARQARRPRPRAARERPAARLLTGQQLGQEDEQDAWRAGKASLAAAAVPERSPRTGRCPCPSTPRAEAASARAPTPARSARTCGRCASTSRCAGRCPS